MLKVKLKFKLLASFGLVLLLLVVVIGVYQYLANVTMSGFKNLLSQEYSIAEHAVEIKADMLQARRDEKDFLLRKDKKYQAQVNVDVEKIQDEARTIVELAGRLNDQESVAKAASIIDYAEQYNKAFKELVASWELRGLDPDSGLQGKFRDIAHALSEDLKGHEIDELQIGLLMIRRYEKDFIRTGTDKYKQKWLEAIQAYQDHLEKSECEKQSRQMQEHALDSYKESVTNYLTAGQSAGQHEQYYQVIRSAAHDMELAIEQVLIPSAGALLLGIRKNEKDYIMRQDEKYVVKTHQSLERLRATVQSSGILQQHKDDVLPLLESYKKAFDLLVTEDKKIAKLLVRMRETIHLVEPAVQVLHEAAEQRARDKVEVINKTTATLSRLAFSVGSVAVLLGMILAVFISSMVVKPLSKITESLRNMSAGEGDLTQRLKVDCPVCSDVTKCKKTECQSYGKKNICWEASGTMADKPECIEVTSGRITDCADCKVYKQANYDELQELSSNFNMFILKLQRMFKNVVQGVVTISSATTELSAIAAQMSGGAANVSAQSNSVATAAEEMSVNMDSVAAATEQTTTNMNIVASATEEMTATISDVNANTERASRVTGEAVEEAKSATIKVQQLGTAANEISKVTEVINDISGQTNLLALNATIEAARAGEAGKGFAVVANEIKELAKQTADATGQIKSQVEGIQHSTTETVVQIERITEVINNVNDTVGTIAGSVKEQAAATDEISSNVAQAAQGLSEVNENVAQSSVVSGQIAHDIATVNQAATEMAGSSSEVQKSAAELSETAEKLKDMVGGFKL